MRIHRKRQNSFAARQGGMPRHAVESLESRAMLAAHIAGSPVVYTTIQAAVDAAAPNAVITVDPGVYPELVGINEPLTIRGANWSVDPRGGARQDPSQETIVTGESVGNAVSSGFYIAASDVTIDGFTVQGNTSQGIYGAGIVIGPNQSGTHIVNNIVQNNIAGLYLSNASATDAALIQHNIFKYNNNPGGNSGRGIYTDGSVSGGVLQNVTIDGNFFFTNYGGAGTTGLEGAIGLEAVTAVQTDIRITNNVMEGDGKALLAFNASNLTITGNVATSVRDIYSGTFRFEGGITNAVIQNNTVYNNGSPAVRIDAKSVSGVSSGFVVTNNNFYGNGRGFENPNASVAVLGGTYSGTLDLRSNYWGSTDGPSGDYTGTGDGIYSNGSSVLYAPWSAAPVFSQESPFDGSPSVTGVQIQAENYDQGGAGFGYQTGRTKNAGGAYRVGGVSIAADSDVDQGYKIGSTAAGQWYAYSITVAQAGSYRIDYRLANGQTVGGKFHFEIDGVNVTGTLTAPGTGSYTTYQTLSSGTFNLSAGNHVLKLVLDTLGNGGAVADFNWMQITNAATPLVPTGLALTTASATEFDLSWATSDASTTSFQIWRQTAGGAFTQIATVNGTARTYADTTVASNTNYGYEVIAINGSGSSLDAGPISATTATPPGAPANFTQSSATAASITFTWTAPSGATGFQLYRQLNGGTLTLVTTLSSSVTSYTDTGVTAGTTYQYTLTATNAGGTGGSASASATTICQPPASIIANSYSAQVSLSWASVVGAVSYNIYRGTNAGGEGATPIAQGVQGTTYIDPGLATNSTYYYVVRAVNTAGISAPSAEANSGTLTAPPVAPTLSATASGGQIVLTWTGGGNTQSYKIYRSTQSNREASGLLASNVIAGTFSDSSVQSGTTYFYVVTAVNSVGESSFSNEVSGSATPSVISAPSGLAVVAAGNRILVSWSPVTDATGYLLYKGTAAGAELSTPISLTSTSYNDSNVSVGSTYFYQVVAVTSAGTSARSAEVSTSLAGALPTNTIVTGNLPATIIAGQAKVFTQTLTFVNANKSAVSQTLTTHWFLSTTTTVSGSAIALPGVLRKTVRLKANARVAIPMRFTSLPASIKAGAYYLIAQTTDSSGAISTAVSTRTITIAAPNVAIAAAFSGVPHSAQSGKPLSLSLKITNAGNVAGSGSLPLTLTVVDELGNVLQTLSFKRPLHIAAGKGTILKLSVKLLASLPSQIAVNALLTPVGAVAFATGSPVAVTTPMIGVITRSGVR